MSDETREQRLIREGQTARDRGRDAMRNDTGAFRTVRGR